MEIHATNVNQAYAQGLRWLAMAGVEESSRNGPVIVSPEPVMTIYSQPRERVLFSPQRDANPFFHLMESLWILAGGYNIKFPSYFNARFAGYSDDGYTEWGAYGRRWRSWFQYDQLELLIGELKKNPETRRGVLAMWDANKHDVGAIPFYAPEASDLDMALGGGKDVPCNTHIYVDARGGKLNITVLCRSNDIVWGVYGANAVQFSMLQEYLAAAVGVPVGVYRQFSNNFHIYKSICGDPEQMKLLALNSESHDLYEDGAVEPYPVMRVKHDEWMRDLRTFIELPGEHITNPDEYFLDPFFYDVAVPMYAAYACRKEKRGTGLEFAERIAARDWRVACITWILRKENVKRAANA